MQQLQERVRVAESLVRIMSEYAMQGEVNGRIVLQDVDMAALYHDHQRILEYRQHLAFDPELASAYDIEHAP